MHLWRCYSTTIIRRHRTIGNSPRFGNKSFNSRHKDLEVSCGDVKDFFFLFKKKTKDEFRGQSESGRIEPPPSPPRPSECRLMTLSGVARDT